MAKQSVTNNSPATTDAGEAPVVSDADIRDAFKTIGINLKKDQLAAGRVITNAELGPVMAPFIMKLLIDEATSLDKWEDVLTAALHNRDIETQEAADLKEAAEMPFDIEDIRMANLKDLVQAKSSLNSCRMKVVEVMSKFLNYEASTAGGGNSGKKPPIFPFQQNITVQGGNVEGDEPKPATPA